MSNEILRVGFSTNDGTILEGHFGHCEKFVIYTIENGKAINKEIVTAPEHTHGAFPKFMAEQKVNIVITGGMGQKAMDILKANKIEVILGASGKIEDILKVYLEGNLVSDGAACAHHHHEHHEEHNCKH